jgi:hypothetical protein
MGKSKELIVLLFLTIGYLNTSQARDQLLATFTSDDNNASYRLTISLSDHDQTLTSINLSKVLSNNSIKNREIPINEFIRDGISLYQDGIHNITKLYSDNLSEQDGGLIVIESSVNSSLNNDKIYKLMLSKDNSEWSLRYKNKIIKNIHATLGITGNLDLIID